MNQTVEYLTTILHEQMQAYVYQKLKPLWNVSLNEAYYWIYTWVVLNMKMKASIPPCYIWKILINITKSYIPTMRTKPIPIFQKLIYPISVSPV